MEAEMKYQFDAGINVEIGDPLKDVGGEVIGTVTSVDKKNNIVRFKMDNTLFTMQQIQGLSISSDGIQIVPGPSPQKPKPSNIKPYPPEIIGE